MINIIKKNYAKISAFALAVAGTITLAVNKVSAAADADLTSALASTSGIITDNKGDILTFFATIIGIVLILGVAIAVMLRAKRMIVGGVAGGRRKGK